MKKTFFIVAILGVISVITILGYRSSTIERSSLGGSVEQPVRLPGGESREARMESAAASNSPQGQNGTGAVSESTREMNRVAGVPVNVGKSGLWAGEMPADAAIGGRVAYAVARAGSSRADLRPDQNGMFQRMHAAKDQKIEFQVRYPGLKSSDWVNVGILDGGTLDAEGPIKPDKEGRVSFTFQTGPSDGSYRIILTTSDNDTKMIDVWAGRPEWEEPITTR